MGLPAAGRNAGARLAATRYVLFVDADVVLEDRTLLRRAVEQDGEQNKLHCLTTNIWCPDGDWRDRVRCTWGNNLFQYAGGLGETVCDRNVHALRKSEVSMHSGVSTKMRSLPKTIC